MHLFIEYLWRDPDYFVTWLLVVVFSVCLHELAHAYAALSQGDDTAVRRGYGTLDPRRLMGPSSLLMLALVGIAWGAVPVTPSRMRHRWSPAIVAASGPLTNLALAAVSVFAWVGTETFAPGAKPFHMLFRCGAQSNALLACLNLLPIPMFDGWEILRAAVPALGRLGQERLNTLNWVLIAALFLTPARALFTLPSLWLIRGFAALAGAILPG
ncbi:MAG: site-2 protease family protein [Lentisphaeria bacterium]|nr:site-2 protease family protein [Lentisphaeria bacterium]